MYKCAINKQKLNEMTESYFSHFQTMLNDILFFLNR